MKRMHIHAAVPNADEAIPFYSALFATEPSAVKPGYAKWMLDDPRVNFAISARSETHGLDHLGIQAENPNELAEIHGRLQAAGRPVFDEGDTTCCYAKSTKSWIGDPAGIVWEAFLTTGESTFHGDASDKAEAVRIASKPEAGACCGPQAKEAAA